MYLCERERNGMLLLSRSGDRRRRSGHACELNYLG